MLCVIAKIDSESKNRLIELQQSLGIPVPKLYGHITLAAYIGEDKGAFISSCKEILLGYSAFPV